MKYLEITIKSENFNEDLGDALSSLLGEIGFDMFSVEEDKLLAYIPSDNFDNSKLQNLLQEIPLEANFTYDVKEMEDKNWNEEWEKNYFSPIIVDNQCVVKSSFHKDVPDYKYTIIINPKMAFGTGHHQTTRLMMQEILKIDFTNKSVLDMGCGTGILAILASMKGAKSLTAIDIDEWAYDNIIENLSLNNINNIEVKIGDASLLGAKKYDIIIANINRNVLLADMEHYASVLNNDGILLLSGFYLEDVHMLEVEANKNNLKLDYFAELDNWCGMRLNKKN